MLFFLRAWRLRDQQSAINSEVDDLIFLYGSNAYEEARRRRAQANDLSAARHWSAVKSEIGRRILEMCGDSASFDRLNSRLIASDDFGYAIWDPPAEDRAEARRLAERMETAQSAMNDLHGDADRPAVQPPAAARPRTISRRRVEHLLSWKGGHVPAEARCDA